MNLKLEEVLPQVARHKDLLDPIDPTSEPRPIKCLEVTAILILLPMPSEFDCELSPAPQAMLLVRAWESSGRLGH